MFREYWCNWFSLIGMFVIQEKLYTENLLFYWYPLKWSPMYVEITLILNQDKNERYDLVV